jgi:AcrR family transcriptional regulator
MDMPLAKRALRPRLRTGDGLATDGRVRRSQRSDQAIVAAMLELIGEGVLDPTAQQVADRARVGLRTVFRRFSDMESLFAELDARLQTGALPLLIGGRPQGTLPSRASDFVRQRMEFFEHIGPYKRAANVKRWRSPFLSTNHARFVRVLRSELLRWMPELGRAASALVDAVELATSFEAWDRLRSEQGLSRARAQAAIECTVRALIGDLRGSSKGGTHVA